MNSPTTLPRFFPLHKAVSILIFFLAGLIFSYCSKKEKPAEPPTIIARVGDKTITLDEFIRRAEFTVRPAYCNSDNYIHKKIVLNSLIAEKLLALEAGKDSDLMHSEEIRLYLQGRKEQAMRQWLYYKEAYEKAKVDEDEVKQVYEQAGKTYKLAYFSVADAGLAERLGKEINRGKSFEAAHREAGRLAAIAEREVAYEAPESREIHQALFSGDLKKSQVIGPLRIENDDHLFIKVLGWTDKLSMSDVQIQRRWQDVSQRLTEEKAGAAFENYVQELMRGKRLDFDPSTFAKVVNIVGPYYLKSSKEKEAMFNKQFWNRDDNQSALTNMGDRLDAVLDAPLFRIDGQVWTVRDLEREIKIHPLVFRKRQFNQKEFAGQFKLAVVDMVRDRYITKDAYEKGYDRAGVVQQNVEMWEDNLLFLYQQNKYLKSIGKQESFATKYLEIIESDLNLRIDSLQAKYGNMIEINTDAFEKTTLTSIDMLAIQRNVPFPVIVPNFPVVTTDNMLDYGRKME